MRIDRAPRHALRRPLGRRLALGFVPLLVLLTGCPPGGRQPEFIPPRTRGEALERVNANLGRINAPLHCTALVSVRFRDARDRQHRILLQEARLDFAAPQYMLFDIRSLAGTVAEFGSNAERYWLWLDVPDFRKLWWGEWARLSSAAERRLPVPPNELLDALMLRPLPETLEGGQLPLLRVEGQDVRLIFVRLGGGGQPTGSREVRLDPRPPYQPLEVIDRSAEGAVVMHAQLSNYRRIGDDGPLTPHRYIVNWPLNDAELRVDITRARFNPALTPEAFEFPAGWKGEREQIDLPDTLEQP